MGCYHSQYEKNIRACVNQNVNLNVNLNKEKRCLKCCGVINEKENTLTVIIFDAIYYVCLDCISDDLLEKMFIRRCHYCYCDMKKELKTRNIKIILNLNLKNYIKSYFDTINNTNYLLNIIYDDRHDFNSNLFCYNCFYNIKNKKVVDKKYEIYDLFASNDIVIQNIRYFATYKLSDFNYAIESNYTIDLIKNIISNLINKNDKKILQNLQKNIYSSINKNVIRYLDEYFDKDKNCYKIISVTRVIFDSFILSNTIKIYDNIGNVDKNNNDIIQLKFLSKEFSKKIKHSNIYYFRFHDAVFPYFDSIIFPHFDNFHEIDVLNDQTIINMSHEIFVAHLNIHDNNDNFYLTNKIKKMLKKEKFNIIRGIIIKYLTFIKDKLNTENIILNFCKFFTFIDDNNDSMLSAIMFEYPQHFNFMLNILNEIIDIDKNAILKKSLMTNNLYLKYFYRHDSLNFFNLSKIPSDKLTLENKTFLFDLIEKFNLLTYDIILYVYGLDLYRKIICNNYFDNGFIDNNNFDILIYILIKGDKEYDNFINHLIKYKIANFNENIKKDILTKEITLDIENKIFDNSQKLNMLTIFFNLGILKDTHVYKFLKINNITSISSVIKSNIFNPSCIDDIKNIIRKFLKIDVEKYFINAINESLDISSEYSNHKKIDIIENYKNMLFIKNDICGICYNNDLVYKFHCLDVCYECSIKSLHIDKTNTCIYCNYRKK